MTKSKSLKIQIAIIVLLFVLWIMVLIQIDNRYENEKNMFLERQLSITSSNINSVIQTYREFADYIFNNIVLKDEIVSVFDEAYESDESKQELLREELYNLLIGNYNQMVDYNFRQLHFHFPNGDSFLRFHKPGVYGDNLFSVRETVKIANTNKEYISAFEEGRIYNGYRFVYPISNNDVHVGSVEVSISLVSIYEILNNLYPLQQTIFILDKNIVESSVFENQRENYVDFFASDDYVMDKELYDLHFIKNEKENLFAKEKITEALKAEFKELDNIENAKTYYKKTDEKEYIICLIPIENIKNETVGSYIVILEDEFISVIEYEEKRAKIVVTVFFIMILIFSIILGADKRKLTKMATLDKLTQIYNRYVFTEKANKDIIKTKKSKNELSFLMFDIDHFKNVNDTYGHEMGDFVLKELAKVVSSCLRKDDVFARWGGEEFVISMYKTNIHNAYIAAERIREKVEQHDFNEVKKVTISLGVSGFKDSKDTLDTIIKRADDAMYESKKNGRNQTTIHSEI